MIKHLVAIFALGKLNYICAINLYILSNSFFLSYSMFYTCSYEVTKSNLMLLLPVGI